MLLIVLKKSVICMNGILIKLDIYDNGYTTFVYSLEFTFEMWNISVVYQVFNI